MPAAQVLAEPAMRAFLQTLVDRLHASGTVPDGTLSSSEVVDVFVPGSARVQRRRFRSR